MTNLRTSAGRTRTPAEPDASSYTALVTQWDGGYDVFVVHVDRGLIGRTWCLSRNSLESEIRTYLEVQRGFPRGARIRILEQ
jgi:hypothetical protein